MAVKIEHGTSLLLALIVGIIAIVLFVLATDPEAKSEISKQVKRVEISSAKDIDEAETEAAKILEDAKAEAGGIAEDARKQAEQYYNEMVIKAQKFESSERGRLGQGGRKGHSGADAVRINSRIGKAKRQTAAVRNKKIK